MVELTAVLVSLATEVAAVVASVVCAVVDSAAVVEAAAVVDASVEAGTVEDTSVDDAAAVVVVDVAFSAWAAKPPALSSATVELGSADEEDEDSESEPELEPEPELPSVLKVTMLAVPPLGTVTTQNDAPPAPTADSLLSTSPEELGEMEQGSPLQPPSGHSILTPKVGRVLIKEEPV